MSGLVLEAKPKRSKGSFPNFGHRETWLKFLAHTNNEIEIVALELNKEQYRDEIYNVVKDAILKTNVQSYFR